MTIPHCFSSLPWRITLASLLGLGACQATNTVSSNRPITPNAVDVSYKVNNPELASQVRVISAYEDTRNGLIHAQINVRNEGAGDVWYMWQVVWTDRNGMQIPVEPVIWNRETIAERQECTIQFMAPTRDSYDWRLTLQKWDRK